MNVHIKSDGTYFGSSVEDAETGKPIERVASVDMHIDYKDVSAMLYMDAPFIDVTCHATVVVEQTLLYDPNDIDSIDKAIALLSERRTVLAHS